MTERNTRIRASQIISILPDDIDATNSPVDSYIPKYDQATGKFTWVAQSAGTPGGSDTQIQFNDGDSFGGDADLTWDKTNNILTINGQLRLKNIAGNTLIVAPNCSYTTIQSAITDATSGDTILVAEGTYNEALSGFADNITLKAIGSKENTIIQQANTTVIDLGIASGIVIDGFTINITGANSSNDYCIYSNNDDSSEYNIIRNCDISWVSSVALANHKVIYIYDGNFEMINCKITCDSNYTGTNTNDGVIIYQVGTGHTLKLTHCEIVGDWESTGGSSHRAINIKTGWVKDCKFDLESEATTSGYTTLIYIVSGTLNIFNSYIEVDCNGTGLSIGYYTETGTATINSYNNVIDISNADADSEWARIASGNTLNSYGDKIKDGDITTGGTINLYDTNEDGRVNTTKNSIVRVYRSGSSQTIPTSTWTKVQFNSETFDIQSEFDSTTNYRFTAKKAGYYRIYSQLHYIDPVADKYYGLEIYKNGSIVSSTYMHASRNNADVCPSINEIVYLDINDWIEIWTFHDKGSDANVRYDSVGIYTWLTIEKIA